MTRTNFSQTISTMLECRECNSTQTIRRRKCRKKKKGHRKILHCVKCGKKTLHVELGFE